ncbi:MAG: 3-isopropylmalate dehydrogenase [Demequina sp.]
MSTAYKLAVVGGDGIGSEVVAEGLKCLTAATEGTGITFETTDFDLGAKRWHATGETLNDTDLEAIRRHDVILLGAIGDPSVPSGVLERGLLLKLRFALDQYVNLRPSRLYPGEQSPLRNAESIDFVVVREGTEGPYVGNGGAMRVDTPHEIATEVSVNTRHGVERVVRYAFTVAQARERKHVTLVHKHNVLVHAGHLWRRTVEAVAEEFPDVTWDYLHIDAATIVMTTDPARFDVIVTDNLFGDILTDQAAAISGGIGLAASANINADKTAPSMFEPVHGSAPDIAGQGIADPSATVLSVAMMLDFLGHQELAQKVEDAVATDAAERGTTKRTTVEIGDALAARIKG